MWIFPFGRATLFICTLVCCFALFCIVRRGASFLSLSKLHAKTVTDKVYVIGQEMTLNKKRRFLCI